MCNGCNDFPAGCGSPLCLNGKEKVCEDCWQWEEPEYSELPGKCLLSIYEDPYANTTACDQFEDKYEE